MDDEDDEGAMIHDAVEEPHGEMVLKDCDSAAIEDPNDYSTCDPIEKISMRALRLSGITYDAAFAIDTCNLGKKLGEYTMSRLAEILFDRIYKDQNEWFRSMFSRVSQGDMTQNMADYLMQRLGGSPYYSTNKGIPALIRSHMNVDISVRAAERWLVHFEDALDDLEDEITIAEKRMVLDHMKYSAFFLVAAQVQQRDDAATGIHFLDS